MAVILLLQSLKKQLKIWSKIKLNERDFIMESFNEASVIALRSEIESKFREFMIDSAKPTVKAAVIRSRKRTSELTLLFKKYRAISIK